MPVIDKLWWYKTRKENPGFTRTIEIHVPEDEKSEIEAAVNPDTETYWQTDYRYYDQYTLKEIEVDHMYGKLSNTSMADKIMRMNYDIHIGPSEDGQGKPLPFSVSLLQVCR